jgi:predicted TIM-barrel fold metal-dependent hydrolase
MTENNDSSARLDRLERLMEQQSIDTADITQQIKEVSTQIKTQATFYDRFDQSLSATKQLIESNAKAIAANITSIDSERKAIRELRRSIRESRFDNLDRHPRTSRKDYALYDILEEIQEDIREIGRKIDRQNPSA